MLQAFGLLRRRRILFFGIRVVDDLGYADNDFGKSASYRDAVVRWRREGGFDVYRGFIDIKGRESIHHGGVDASASWAPGGVSRRQGNSSNSSRR